MSSISVIVPTLNEEAHISKLLKHLISSLCGDVEIILVDGGSIDGTVEKVKEFSEVKVLSSERKGRAVQMNIGAEMATGQTLYFVHADVIPPLSWCEDIREAISLNKVVGGYRFKFDSNRSLLRFNSWMTRFNILSFRGGDQTLYITSAFFKELKGYQNWEIMEEYDLIKRARRMGCTFNLIQKDVVVSARKYEKNNYFKINFANGLAMLKFRLGVDHKKIKEAYFRTIKHPKS